MGVFAACRPDSVTGARDRLTGGDARTVQYRLPLTEESYGILSFLENTKTEVLEDGLVAIPLRPDTVRGTVGTALLFTREVELEVVERVRGGALRRDELASAVAVSEVRRAPLRLTLRHTSRATLVLVDLALALVRTDDRGRPARDGGDLDLERGATGDPIRVPLGDTLRVPPRRELAIERDAAALVDRLSELLVAREPVAIVVTGSLRVSQADQARVRPDDALLLVHRAFVGLDLILPDTGVVLRRGELLEGLGFSDRDRDDIQERVLRAGSRVEVENEIPFRVRVDIAYVAGDRRGDDVFAAEDGVLLDPLTVAGRRGTAAAPRDTLAVEVPGSQVRPLLGDVFTLALRVRLLPGPGPGGRGALRVGDAVRIDAQVFADLRSWNGS